MPTTSTSTAGAIGSADSGTAVTGGSVVSDAGQAREPGCDASAPHVLVQPHARSSSICAARQAGATRSSIRLSKDRFAPDSDSKRLRRTHGRHENSGMLGRAELDFSGNCQGCPPRPAQEPAAGHLRPLDRSRGHDARRHWQRPCAVRLPHRRNRDHRQVRHRRHQAAPARPAMAHVWPSGADPLAARRRHPYPAGAARHRWHAGIARAQASMGARPWPDSRSAPA